MCALNLADLKSWAVAILVAAVTLHTVYIILRSLWRHRNPPEGSGRRCKFELKVSYESEPETPRLELPPASKPEKHHSRILRLIR